MQNIPFTEVQSSNVVGYGYDAQARRLAVTFKGGNVYHYEEVPAEAVEALAKAESFGSHLQKCIRPHFRSHKIET